MISEKELEGYERVVSDRLYDGTYVKRIVLKLIKEVRNLDAECEMLAEIMPDCPVKYGSSVWCMRRCPVWGRHDINGPDYYCTNAERREYARKSLRKMKNTVERETEYLAQRLAEIDLVSGGNSRSSLVRKQWWLDKAKSEVAKGW